MNVDLSALIDAFGQPAMVGNCHVFNKPADSRAFRIRGEGHNVAVLPARLLGSISLDFRATSSCVIIEAERAQLNAVVGHGCCLVVSKGCTFTGPTRFTLGEGKDVFLGEDCLFAEDVYVSNTDGHPIFDDDGRRINHSRGILIGDHVWLGRGVEVLKGSTIQSGAIVGARSLVSGDVPANSLSVGVPARVIKRGVSFSRETTVRRPSIDKSEPIKFGECRPEERPIYQLAQVYRAAGHVK